MRTGDVGYLDAEGYLHVVDRVKDMIVVVGGHVYTSEVEEVLMEHPAVRHAAVFGVSDPDGAEKVHAAVVTAQPVDAEELEDLVERRKGSMYRPTVLSGVTPDQRIYSEEIFGPVTTVLGYDSEDEAIEIMNDTPYGLTAGVITEDTGRGWAVAQRVNTGIFHINDQSVDDAPQAPFGGVKDSGYGRFGGRDGIEAFTDTRYDTFRERGNRARYPF